MKLYIKSIGWELCFLKYFCYLLHFFIFIKKKHIKNEHNSLKQVMRQFWTKWKWAMVCWKMDSNFRIKLKIALFLYIKRVCTVSKGYEDLQKNDRVKFLCLYDLLKKKKKDWKKVFIIFLQYFKFYCKVTPVIKKLFKICIFP